MPMLYGIRDVMDHHFDNNSYNHHYSTTKASLCNNSDRSNHDGTATARIAYNI